MKNLTQVLIVLFCLCMPALLHAQRDDSKYLAGAVPEVDGKVVFTKDFSIPGMSQDTIYSRLLRWMDARLAKNGNNSRVVFSDKEKGQIVGIGDEWIVFSSTALSLDRTKILYQLTVTCQPEKCVFEVEKIRFNYREGKEKYTAEEWITDKYALNKSQTKLVRGLAKWRRKTVDFVDALCIEVTEALSASTAAQAPVEEKKETKALVNSGTTVIAPKTQVTVETPKATATTPATDAIANQLGENTCQAILDTFGVTAPAATKESVIRQASKILQNTIISDAVIVVVLSADDIYNLFAGRISKEQLLKELTVAIASVGGATVGTVAGGAVGTAIAPGVGTAVGKVAGGIVGGTVAGIGSNWVAGKVYEGDAEQMYEIISAKFKELSEEYMTTQEEGDAIVSKMQKELSSSKLKDMYASDDREKFASELMTPMFEEQLANREKISTPTEDEIRYAMIDDMQGIIFIH